MDSIVDFNFSGLWVHHEDQYTLCVNNNTDFLITMSNKPVLWEPNMNTDISLVTMDSEFIVISH